MLPQKTTAKFKSISSLSVSPDGNTFYIGDYQSKYINKLDVSANLVSTIAGNIPVTFIQLEGIINLRQ